MSNDQSPFVVENLTPRNSTGAPTASYELTRASVSPSRIVGRDSLGRPVEETEPTVHWAPFLMPDGCINKVPLRTGSVLSMQAEATAYETETVTELVISGCIPANLCPYSTKYQHLTGGAFVAPPVGASDCGGVSDRWKAVAGGCEHLRALAAARQAVVLKKYNAEADLVATQESARYMRMQESTVAGIGRAIAEHLPQPASATRKQNLRDGKADE
jgi:hypothetical protein